MQKTANRILSALLVLVMVLSMLPATVFATGEAGAFKGWDLTLGENISVNFYFDKAYTVQTTVAGEPAEHEVAVKDNQYVVTVGVSAAQMTDTIGLTAVEGETLVHTGEYSVRQYAETILSGNADAEVKELVQEMLNYGAAAQVFFDYNTDNLACEIVNDTEIPAELPEIVISGEAEGIEMYGASLVLGDKIAVRFYFSVSGNIADYTFSTGSDPVAKDGYYYVEVADILPQDLDKTIAVEVSKGEEKLSVSYSPLTYIGRKSVGASDALKQLLQALYGYYLEANEYLEYVANLPTVIDAGVMTKHSSNGWNADALYFSMAENAAPVGDAIRYKPENASNIKLIRDGQTYDVGHNARETIVKASETGYYMALWTLGDYKPLKANDILIFEGNFINEANKTILNISKSYVLINGDGSAEFSTEMPTLPTTVEGGVMTAVEGYGWTGGTGDLIFKMDNTAPNGGYKPTSAGNIKLIRNGETYDVAYVGVEVFKKDNDGWYTIPFWTIVNYKPMLANDILVIEGDFYQESTKTTLNVSKTYVLLKDGGAAEFSTEMPTLNTVIDAGVMNKHSSNGWNGDALYFSMAENAAPVGDAIRYKPEAASNIKLIRDGQTYDVGHTARETLVKASETGYYMAMWVLGDYNPLKENDILIFEGNFINEANKTILNIAKSYVLINGDGTAAFSTEMPSLNTVIDAGVMNKHSTNGWNGDALYFSMAENAAPVGDAIRYKPEAASNIKLIRDGQTYDVGHTARETLVKASETGYYMAMWVLGDYKPLKENDILIFEGNFINEANKTVLNISKSYVLINADGTAAFSTEMPTLATVIEGGVMTKVEGYGWTGGTGDLIFKMNNTAPNGGYKPTSAGNIKLIRNGETYDIAYMGQEVFNKSNDGWYTIPFWTIVNYKPMLAGDILVIEGEFYQESSNTILNVSKTYVLLKDDNVAEFYTEMPSESTTVDCGTMTENEDGTPEEIYFSMAANSIPVDEETEYPYAGTVQMTVGNNVATVNANIYKLSDDQYYLELDAELADQSYLIVEGEFKNSDNGYTMNISRTYVLNDGGSLVFSTEKPTLSNTIEGGVMIEVEGYGWTGGTGDLIFKMNNTAPNGGYKPTSAGNIKLIRNGETYDIAYMGQEVFNKSNDGWYTIPFWTIVNYKPMLAGDILVIEGDFYQESSNTILNVSKTYVLLKDGAAAEFSTEMPNLSTVVEAGAMQTHPEGVMGNGIRFRMAENEAPYSDWDYEYKQTSVDNVKIIRNGETISIGIVDRPLIVKYDAIDYYLKLEGWTLGEYGWNNQSNPITTDDVLIIEGNLYHEASNTTLRVAKSYVYFDGTAWVCSDSEPVKKEVVDVVELGSHGNGWTSGGFYFIAATNSAPFNTDWSLRYKPLSADAIKLVHNGTVTNKGNTGAETIVKYGENEYYIEGWAVGMSGVVAGDQMIIEGEFYNAANDTTIKVEKTTIIFNADGSTTIISESGKYINAGGMNAYAAGPNWFGTGIYFSLSSNIAPADVDWNVRYTPKSNANIKLIRNGETVNIANTGAETIVKIADGQYWLSLENWWWNAYAPIQDGDVLVIEGEFANATNGFTLNIAKTYIYFESQANDAVQFATAESTEFGDVVLPSTSKTLNIGVWNGSHHVFTDARLAELKAAGITKIMGIDTQWLGTTDVNGWLDRVYSYGIRVIMDLRSWDGETVPDYANHPGVMGFLMYDEPCATDFDKLKALKDKFDAVMPADKLFYVNLFGSSAAGTSLVGAFDWAMGNRDYDQHYVQRFLKTLDVKVLSWDSYALLDSNGAKGIRTGYYRNFEIMASKTGVEKWYTMLSAGHNTTTAAYSTPTAEELRWQMAVAMTYGISNIDHYIYTSHEEEYTTMLDYKTETVTDLYYDIVDVDNEYLAWDNIYMAYNWLGTAGVKAGATSTMLDQLQNNIDLSANGLAVATNKDLLVGVFENAGNKAYMVTNAGSAGNTTVGDGKNLVMEDATVTLTLGEGSYKCVAVIENGEISYVAVNADNTVTLNVQAYEGVFVIPVLN